MTEERNVLLCDLTHMGQKIASDCFPYGIGCLAEYLEAHCSFDVKVHLIKFPNDLYDTIHKYKPRMVGFTNFIWNFDLQRTMAAEIKREFPETVIIFGGPNFYVEESEQERLLRDNPVIDFYIEGEGEIALTALYECLHASDYDLQKTKETPLPSVRTILRDKFISYPLADKLTDLSEVPSPYLSGRMDEFFEKNLMPLVQTTRGCPFSCAYCVEGQSYYNHIRRHSPDFIRAELEYIAERATGNKQIFIADSNFAMYEEDEETASIINDIQKKTGFPYYIHVAAGKNQKQRLLKVARLVGGKMRLSGSVQSLDPEVMQNIRRSNISSNDLLELADDAREIGANSYSEVILALPGDSLEAHMHTMERVINAGFNIVLPWTLLLLQGSELASLSAKEKFNMNIRYRVLPRCFGIYKYGDKTIYTGEVEEACVGSDKMSIDDYLECRIFTLTTALFYNDRLFGEIIELLKPLGIATFDWLMSIHKMRDSFPPSILNLYDSFKQCTLDELWEDREELYSYLKDPENIEKYISGELGMNVMYHHRAEAFINHMDELNMVAFKCAHELALAQNTDLGDIDQFLKELELFSKLRKDRLFDLDLEFDQEFTYDFLTPLASNSWDLRHAEQLKGKYNIHFAHEASQKESIIEQKKVFGSDVVGLAKVLSRIHISKMYRTASISQAQ
ncbi:hypothetical protein BVX97_00940 [bacterium E08(2017)]|nr:hypothetical protein BVX97_00940 [bacterium E08(2017)]